MTNWKQSRDKLRFCAPDAAQPEAVRCRAGAHVAACARPLGPGSGQQRVAARPGRDS